MIYTVRVFNEKDEIVCTVKGLVPEFEGGMEIPLGFLSHEVRVTLQFQGSEQLLIGQVASRPMSGFEIEDLCDEDD